MKLLIALSAAAALGCAPVEQAAPEGAPAGILLVGNKGENTLSFIDLATGRELGRAATGHMPHEISISPDGRQAAVVAYGGRTIDIFDVASRAKLRTVDLSPNQGPHGLAWLEDGRILVTTERSQSLTIVDTRDGDAVTAIATGQQGTHMVAVSPDARRAYTANIQAGTVSVIDLENGRLIRNVAVGGAPEAIALTPDGRTLWVGDLEGARVQAFDAAALEAEQSRLVPVANISYAVAGARAPEIEAVVTEPLERALRGWPGIVAVESRIRDGRGWTQAVFAAGTAPPTPEQVLERVRAASGTFPQGRTDVSLRVLSAQPLAVVDTGDVPIRVVASPDGRWIVTSNLGCGCVTVIEARTRAAVREFPVSGERQAGQVTILFSADGKRLYVAETGRDQVAEVDFESGAVLRRLAAGAQGDGLAIAPPAR